MSPVESRRKSIGVSPDTTDNIYNCAVFSNSRLDPEPFSDTQIRGPAKPSARVAQQPFLPDPSRIQEEMPALDAWDASALRRIPILNGLPDLGVLALVEPESHEKRSADGKAN